MSRLESKWKDLRSKGLIIHSRPDPNDVLGRMCTICTYLHYLHSANELNGELGMQELQSCSLKAAHWHVFCAASKSFKKVECKSLRRKESCGDQQLWSRPLFLTSRSMALGLTSNSQVGDTEQSRVAQIIHISDYFCLLTACSMILWNSCEAAVNPRPGAPERVAARRSPWIEAER